MERTRLQIKPSAAILLLSIILTIAPAAAAQDIQVNTSGWWHHADAFNASTTPIQHAINNATAGDTILVHDGTYTEQVIINKSLTLRNASGHCVEHPDPPIHIPSPILNSAGRPRGGQSSHLTRPPSMIPANASGPGIVAPPDPRDVYTFSESGSTWDPIIFAYGGVKSGGDVSGSEVIDVNITGFVIYGEDGCPIGRFTGILCRNVEGDISRNVVKNMTVNDQETFGIAVYGDSDVTISSNNVSGYVRGGIVVNVAKLQVKPLAAILLLSMDSAILITPVVMAEDIYVNTTGWWYQNGVFNASTTPISMESTTQLLAISSTSRQACAQRKS